MHTPPFNITFRLLDDPTGQTYEDNYVTRRLSDFILDLLANDDHPIILSLEYLDVTVPESAWTEPIPQAEVDAERARFGALTFDQKYLECFGA